MTNAEAYKWLYVHFAPCGDETQQDSAVTKALEALKKQIPPTIEEWKTEWIPCSETIDIPKDDVLCCCKDGEIVIGALIVITDGQWLCESDGGVIFDPVAWMPLPEPMKMDGRDKLE